MQLCGPGVFGPPKDRAAAIAVLRAAIEAGVDHLDTADFYGPHVVDQIIEEALHPHPKNLVLVTKVSCRRGPNAEWIPAFSREELTKAVHENLENLGVDALDVVATAPRAEHAAHPGHLVGGAPGGEPGRRGHRADAGDDEGARRDRRRQEHTRGPARWIRRNSLMRTCSRCVPPASTRKATSSCVRRSS